MHRQIIIIRHGEGNHLTEGFFSSRPDHPNYRPAHLTTKGRQQAIRAGQKLLEAGIHDRDVGAVLISPLPRTVETADGIFAGGHIQRSKGVIEPLLTEIGLGDLEGTSTQGWIDRGYGFTDFSHGHTYGGETNEDVANRMSTLLAKIQTTYTTGHIIAVTHALPAYELSGMLGPSKVELGVASPLFLTLDERRSK